MAGDAVDRNVEPFADRVLDQNSLLRELDHEAAAALGEVLGKLAQRLRDETFNHAAFEALDRVFAQLLVLDPRTFQDDGEIGGMGPAKVWAGPHLAVGGWCGGNPEGETREDRCQHCRAEAALSYGMDQHRDGRRLTGRLSPFGDAGVPRRFRAPVFSDTFP